MPNTDVREQVINLEQNLYEARQDINVGKYYFAVQTLIGVGFFTYLIRSGYSTPMTIATTTVGIMPGLMCAKIKLIPDTIGFLLSGPLNTVC